MPNMKILDAARIMAETYDGANDADVRMRIDIRGVQAVFLKDKTLVIPGSNELSDWFDFNFDVTDPSADSLGFDVVPGDSGARWHAGFLEHAQTVYTFAKPLQPKLIIGHSLGAAAAQIVGTSLRVPSIAFASPRTHRGVSGLQGEEWVVNFCRTDDTVCHVPPNFLGFRHVGHRYWLSPGGVNVGGDHKMENYIALMQTARIREHLPATWPR